MKDISYIDGDFVYAIKNPFDKKIVCKLFLSGIEVNRFTVNADTIHTMFYDTPLYLICLRNQKVSMRIFDNETNTEFHVLPTLYFGFFYNENNKMKICHNLHICKLDNRFMIYRDGIGTIVNNIPDTIPRNTHIFL